MVTEKVLRNLEDYKLNLSFLEAELADLDFHKEDVSASCIDPNTNAAATMDHAMTGAGDENLLQMSLHRDTSLRSHITTSLGAKSLMQTKSHDVAHLKTQY